MNYKYVILVITFLFGLADWVTYNRPRLQKQLFNGLFLFLYLATIACYYWGIDMAVYYNHFYFQTPSLPFLIRHPDASWFEPGYNFLVSAFHTAGWSLYALYVTTWTLAYLALWKVFSTFSTTWRSFAMMLFMGFCFDNLFFAIRQTWSFIFFLALILALRRKCYLWAALSVIGVCLMHRSGSAIILVFGVTYLFFHNGFSRRWYVLLAGLLLVQLFMPPSIAFLEPLRNIPLIGSQWDHLAELLARGRTFSPAILLFLAFCVVGFRLDDQHDKLLSCLYLTGCIIIVAMYRYVGLLIRFQYYVTPFLCIGLMNALYGPLQGVVRRKLLRTACVAYFALYWGLAFTYTGPRADHHPVTRSSLVFERRQYSAPYLQARQLDRVARFKQDRRSGRQEDFKDTRFVSHTK